MDPYDIGEAFEAIEQELVASMIRNMDRHRAEETKEGYEWAQWQAQQLKALEAYKKANRKKYAGKFRDINNLIDSAIFEARKQGNMEQEITILNAIKKGFSAYSVADGDVMAEFFKLNDRKLEALIKATKQDFEKAEYAVLRRAEDQYRQIIYNAQVYANTGAATYEKAVDMASKDFLARGIDCIEYANGARHTISDWADMAIRTAAKRAYLTGEGEKRKEWGVSTVIMNKRSNPCPKCLPFVGKVLIDDVWSGGTSKDGNYPLMSRAIELGLYHPRCKDSHSTYFEGISTPPDDTFSKKDIENIKAEYTAEQQSLYAKRQAQKYERLEKHSLDKENKQKYGARKQEWQKQVQAYEIETLKEGIVNYGIDKTTNFEDFKQKYLKDVENIENSSKILSTEETVEKAKQYAENLLKDSSLLEYGNGHPIVNYVNKQLGYDTLPKVLSAEEFDKQAQSKTLLFRGLEGNGDMSADEMAEAFKSGKFFCGRGIYGNGTYCTVSKEIAEEYARSNDSVIMELFLSDNAKVADFKTIFKEFEKTGIPKIIGDKPEAYQEVIADVGTFAAIKGYDAIALNGFKDLDYIVLLNRGKAIVKE